jgi:O-acetylhomoserine (thiol)-lyase
VLTEALKPVGGPIAFIIGCRVLGLRDLGPAMAPMNAFLTLTGMETLALRMERHCANALHLAQWLQNHPAVAWVSYAGLPEDPSPAGPAIPRRQGRRGVHLRREGRVRGGGEAGPVGQAVQPPRQHRRYPLAHHPPRSTTHSQLGEEELVAAGAGPDTVRVSVGIEHIDDIVADLAQALEQV